MALKLCSLRETFEETGLLLIPSQKSDASKGTDDESWDLPRCRAVGWKESGIEKEEWARIREEVSRYEKSFRKKLLDCNYSIYLLFPVRLDRSTMMLRNLSHSFPKSPTKSTLQSLPIRTLSKSLHSHL